MEKTAILTASVKEQKSTRCKFGKSMYNILCFITLTVKQHFGYLFIFQFSYNKTKKIKRDRNGI